jgi:RNAse (barnase) inhibitor barstar
MKFNMKHLFLPLCVTIIGTPHLKGMESNYYVRLMAKPSPMSHRHQKLACHVHDLKTLINQHENPPPFVLSAKEKKAHARSFNLIASSAILGATGLLLKRGVVQESHRSRSFGTVEGAAAISQLLAPLGTAITLGVLWYKFNNLIHYQCKTEREQDVQKITDIATQNKTELQAKFDEYTKNIDLSLTLIRQEAKVQAEKYQQENVQLIQRYQQTMEQSLGNITNNLNSIQTELQTTERSNIDLKTKLEDKALPLLQKIVQEVSTVREHTTKELAHISSKSKEQPHNHKRNISGMLHFLHKCSPYRHPATVKRLSLTRSSEEKSDT